MDPSKKKKLAEVIKRLNNKSESIQKRALLSLARLTSDEYICSLFPKATGPLIKFLKKDDVGTQAIVFSILNFIFHRTLPNLYPSSRPSKKILDSGIKITFKIFRETKDKQLCSMASETLSHLAYYACGTDTTMGMVPVLLELIKTGPPRIRRGAALALDPIGRLQTNHNTILDHTDDFIGLLKVNDEYVRRVGARIMEQLILAYYKKHKKKLSVSPILVNLIKTNCPEVGRAAIHALYSYSNIDPRSKEIMDLVPFFESLLSSNDEKIKHEAEIILYRVKNLRR